MAGSRDATPTLPEAVSEVDACEKFDHILNFRDVGRTINQFLGKSVLTEGILYRSARPDDASRSDRKRLLEDYQIKTIIDLRTKTEHLQQARKREADLKTPSVLLSNDALAEPVKIPDINYVEINLNGKGFERSMVWQLPWYDILKLVILMLFGYRTQAISIFSTKIMKPRGLIGLGLDTLRYSGPEVAEAVRACFPNPSAPSPYPIVIHCTQGKDRTGLIIALLLYLLSIPLEAVDYDYMLTQPALVPERAERIKDMAEIGLGEDFADCDPAWMGKLKEWLDDEYGGVEGYLAAIGVEKETVLGIKEVLGA